MSIAILDYDMANLRSVQKGFEKHGHGAVIVRRPEELKKFDKLVLPGVGAFKDAVGTLRERGLVEPILEHIGSGRPLLGICLGLQILFETGLEDGEHAGLGVFGGVCRRFDVDTRLGLKVPHMGWNTLDVVRRSPLMEGLTGEVSVYFVHGYHVEPTDRSIIATTTDYGGAFVSSVWKENVMAVQFHPEKSQAVGLGMLGRFALFSP
jgi:glutamine amidotransferase